MALIHCPECQHELSDTVSTCPHCGYQLKPEQPVKPKSKLPIIVIAAVVVCVIVAVIVYTNVIKPNKVITEAQNMLDRGKLSEAEVLLAGIPNSSRKTEMLAKISLEEAKAALKAGDIELAEEKLALVPDTAAAEVKQELDEQRIQLYLSKGLYNEADAVYAGFEQTQEVIDIRKTLFEDSRILHCALMIKDSLIFPESIMLEEVAYFAPKTSIDKEQSTDTTEVRVYNEPQILIHYSAKTRGGSMRDSFVRFLWEDNKYNMGITVDDLDCDYDCTPPSYLDDDEAREWHKENYEKNDILCSLNYNKCDFLNDARLARLSKAAANYTDKSSEFIPHNEVVPQPTPEVINVTPKPTSTPDP